MTSQDRSRRPGARRSTRIAAAIAMATSAALLVLGVAAAPAHAADGTISGTVTGVGDGPLEGVDVVASVWNETDGYWQMVDFTSTESDGTYSLTLPPDDYVLRFEPAWDSAFGAMYYDGASDRDAADPVTLGSGGAVTGIDAELPLKGHVTGTVTDSVTGNPVPGALVTAYQLYDNDGTPGSEWIADAVADDNGDFDLGVGPGTYKIGFDFWCQDPPCAQMYVTEYWNDKASVLTADDVTVAAGATVTGKDAALLPMSKVKGHVTAGGAPVGGIDVLAYQDMGGYWDWQWSSTTGDNGSYTLELPPGTYRIAFRDFNDDYGLQFYDGAATIGTADDVVVGANATVFAVDADLSPAGAISGTVTDGSSPLSGICVDAYDAQGEYVTNAETDPSGHYTIGGLAAGSYRLAFFDCSGDDVYAFEWYQDKDSIDTADPVAVTAGSTTANINVVLAQEDGQPDIFNQTAPVLSGTPKTGQDLTVTGGEWSEPDVVLGYQWKANGSPIAGAASAPTLHLTGELVGKTITVAVTASKAGFTPGIATSNGLGPVQASAICVTATSQLAAADAKVASTKAALTKANKKVKAAARKVKKLKSGPAAKLAKAKKQLKAAKKKAKKAKKAFTDAVAAQHAAATAKEKACT